MANLHVGRRASWLTIVLLFTLMDCSIQAATPKQFPSACTITCENGVPVILDLNDQDEVFWTNPPASKDAFDCTLIVKRSPSVGLEYNGTGQPISASRYNQIKLTFNSMELTQPNAGGNCTADNLSITGFDASKAKVPANICGSEKTDTQKFESKVLTANFHRHIFFYEGPSQLTLKLTTGGKPTFQKFNLTIKGLRLNSPYAAQAYCTQFYLLKNRESVLIKTPNYPKSADSAFAEYKNQQGFCLGSGYTTNSTRSRKNQPIQLVQLTPIGLGSNPAFTALDKGENRTKALHDDDCKYAYFSRPDQTDYKGYSRFCGRHFNDIDTNATGSDKDKMVQFGIQRRDSGANFVRFESINYRGRKLGFRFVAKVQFYPKTSPTPTPKPAT